MHCPPWCESGIKGHRQALREGCEPDQARTHLSVDLGGQVDDIRNYLTGRLFRPGQGGWRVWLEAGPLMTTLVLELRTITRGKNIPAGKRKHNSVRLDLTTDEARSLAAQLIHLADREDLR
ncbi:hypothetical protein [Nocardioides lianchengensis]|uniref:hypothetical protein n=1 Tax=Nocardioides lianchengensis TaxID=1045774 RepID=UPI000B815597|nr:hypothetical protein [Nocardioides lianchengensis]NYG09627.1 hypothetical protein [Nocardioides lianchengensis]